MNAMSGSKWPMVALGEVAEVVRGVTFAKADAFNVAKPDTLPVLRAGNISNSLQIEDDLVHVPSHLVSEKQLMKTGDVVMCTSSGSSAVVGKSARLEQDWTGSFGAFCTLIRSTGKSDADFLANVLALPEFRSWASNSSGVGIKNIRSSDLKNYQIPLPPLDEQKRIAAILDKADSLRRQRRQALALLDSLTQSIFVEMFGDPVTNPMGWPMVPLGSIGELDRGKSKHRPRNDPVLLGGEHPLIQTGDVAASNGRIKTFAATYSDIGLKQSKKWPKGTLCITIAANIADTGILEFDACFPDSVVAFSHPDEFMAEYVQVWLSFLKKNLNEMAPQAAQKNINLKILRELEMPLPEKEQLARFGETVTKLNEICDAGVSSLARLDTLFASIQSRAFIGELS